MHFRSVLMCVSGMSPAVVTETLYALITREGSVVVPDEIHVVTTSKGKQRVMRELLDPATGAFHTLVREYLPGRSIRFDASTVHVISQNRTSNPFGQLLASPAQSLEAHELDDISNEEENEAAANTIYRVMRQLKSVPGTRLHASVAGGRKSMSFYMGHAFSLLAEPDDELSHVLVNEPFENPRFGFYYPPRTPVQLSYQDDTGKQYHADTAQAEVKLAALSVLKLGPLLGQDWPIKAQESFAFAITLAQAAFDPPKMRVALVEKNTTGRERTQGIVELCGETIELPPLHFMVFALYALTCAHQHAEDLPDGPELGLSSLPDALWQELSDDFDSTRFNIPRNFKPVHSHIHKALCDTVGPAVAEHFRIQTVGAKVQGQQRPYALTVAADKLNVSGLRHWWAVLRKELM